MAYLLAGTTNPIEFKRRPVPSDPDEARAELARLVGDSQAPGWVDTQDDDQVAERLAEHRLPEDLPTTNGQSIVEMSFPNDWEPMDCVRSFLTGWGQCSSSPPVWVECDDPNVQTLIIASIKGDVADKCPADWMKSSTRAWDSGIARITGALGALMFSMAVWLGVVMMLRTNAGRDFQSRVMGDGTEPTAGTGNMRPADYLAITENSAAPALTDTTLTGELAAGGLARSQAAYAHTASSTTYTLIFQWTSSDGTARTIEKMAVFNAASIGTMVFESLVPSPPTLVSGDKLEITSTIDIS